MGRTLDEIQSELWILEGDMYENKVNFYEARAKLTVLTEQLEEIIDTHNLWDYDTSKSS